MVLKLSQMGTAKATNDERLSFAQRGPARDILRLLQQNGPMTTKQLRAALGVSSLNAVREQLTGLSAAGLIEASTLRQGAGRPTYVYALSAKALALFPQGYDVLLKLLLEELAARTNGPELEAILAGVSARLAEHYGGQEAGQALEQRLTTLVQSFAQQGIPISVVEKQDVLSLHGYSCPYYNVAQESSHVCGIEQQMLERVLGRPVRLTRRLVDGHAGCQFVVDAAHGSHGAAQANEPAEPRS